MARDKRDIKARVGETVLHCKHITAGSCACIMPLNWFRLAWPVQLITADDRNISADCILFCDACWKKHEHDPDRSAYGKLVAGDGVWDGHYVGRPRAACKGAPS